MVNEEYVDHPLSPTQENAEEAIVSALAVKCALPIRSEIIYGSICFIFRTRISRKAVKVWHRKWWTRMYGQMKQMLMRRMAYG